MNIQLTDHTLLREIGHIADETRRTPEQIVTEALKHYVRRLSGKAVPADSEDEIMPLERIMDETISVLRHFTENADAIMARCEPGQDSGLLEVMNRLAERLNAVEDEADLVAVADIVHELNNGIPYFPPDESPPRHFQLQDQKQMGDDESCRSHVESHKAALQKVFDPCFRRIEQAWRDTPGPIPPNSSPGAEEPPWDLMGIFQDDPTWLEIEQERHRDRLVSGGGAE